MTVCVVLKNGAYIICLKDIERVGFLEEWFEFYRKIRM